MIVGRLPTFVENRLPVTQRRARAFEKCHGYRPRLRNPLTFSEKVNHRVLRDRRELLSPLGDKLAMKEIARATGADVRVPVTYWSGRDLAELRHVEVSDGWVLKPNHSTNAEVVFGTGRITDPEVLVPLTAGWLDANRHSLGLGEWVYTRARGLLLLEERIGSGARAPTDYKVFVFHGEAAIVEVHEDRFGAHVKRLYRPDWTALPDQPGYPASRPSPPPANLDRLLAAASVLAADYDFMRVDLYDSFGDIWFGEFTPYPASGLVTFAPRELDAEMGALWTLP